MWDYPQNRNMSNRTSVTKVFVVLVSLVLVLSMITSTALSGSYAVAQSNSSSNLTSGSVTNATLSTGPSDLDKKMQQLLSSNDPKDIATLAYIWGYPLISNIRTIDESTDPAHYNDSQANGPWNQFHYRTQLANANFTQLVGPNVDTLYSNLYYDLEKGPVVISVPEGINRYFSLQFIDRKSVV